MTEEDKVLVLALGRATEIVADEIRWREVVFAKEPAKRSKNLEDMTFVRETIKRAQIRLMRQ